MISKIKEELKKTLSMLMADQAAQIKVSDMVVGGKVETVNADGSLSPAQDGEYTVDKDVIVVKDGLIVSINGNTESESTQDIPDESVAMESTAPVETPAEETQETTDLTDLKAQVEALRKETEDLKTALEELKSAMVTDTATEQNMSAEFTKIRDELNATIKTLINLPAEFSKTSKSNVVTDSKDEKLKNFAKIVSSIKK